MQGRDRRDIAAHRVGLALDAYRVNEGRDRGRCRRQGLVPVGLALGQIESGVADQRAYSV